jgi:alanine racemase
VLINGRRQAIPEVGMQSAYVTVDPADKAGDPVILLGSVGSVEVSELDLASAQNTTPHEALLRMASSGAREHRGP